jgi:hypothetical protein
MWRAPCALRCAVGRGPAGGVGGGWAAGGPGANMELHLSCGWSRGGNMELLAVGLDVERGRRAAPKCGGPTGRFGIRNRVAGRPPPPQRLFGLWSGLRHGVTRSSSAGGYAVCPRGWLAAPPLVLPISNGTIAGYSNTRKGRSSGLWFISDHHAGYNLLRDSRNLFGPDS